MKTITAVVAVIVLAVALAATASARSSATPTLKGTVGPGFTITLTKGGSKVKILTAGRYRFVIADKASIHNFALRQMSGGRFAKTLTAVSFVGTKAVTVTLTKGKWEFFCQPHESFMSGTFAVK